MRFSLFIPRYPDVFVVCVCVVYFASALQRRCVCIISVVVDDVISAVVVSGSLHLHYVHIF